MKKQESCNRQVEAGFTMFEALVAIALAGLILGALGSVTAQWLPGWTRGLFQVQRNEQLAIAFDRLAADLSAAEFVPANNLLFDGAERHVTFVRQAVGPNSRRSLEIVQIAEVADRSGPVLVRTRAPFALFAAGDPIPFADPVVLLRPPFRVAFAYADAAGAWQTSWRKELPTGVRIVVRDSERGLAISTATRIHAERQAPRPDPVDEAAPQPRSGDTPGSR
jgi:general secretion pathway protein J